MAKSSRAQVAVLRAHKPIAEIAVHVLVRMIVATEVIVLVRTTAVAVAIAMIVVHEMIAVVATIVHVQTIVRGRMIEMAVMLRQMQSA
jgi:hypothetical protein